MFNLFIMQISLKGVSKGIQLISGRVNVKSQGLALPKIPCASLPRLVIQTVFGGLNAVEQERGLNEI